MTRDRTRDWALLLSRSFHSYIVILTTFAHYYVRRRKFSGVVLAAEEGKRIAETLGQRKVAFLGNHGLLTAGPSIEAAVNWFVMLEKCSQVQLAAEAAVGGRREELLTIGPEEARATWESIGGPDSAYFQGLPLFQLAEREFGEATFLGRGVEPL